MGGGVVGRSAWWEGGDFSVEIQNQLMLETRGKDGSVGLRWCGMGKAGIGEDIWRERCTFSIAAKTGKKSSRDVTPESELVVTPSERLISLGASSRSTRGLSKEDHTLWVELNSSNALRRCFCDDFRCDGGVE